MDKNPSKTNEKVIINPQPPKKAMAPSMIPIPPVPPEGATPPEPVVPVDPGCDPLNNQVEGPEEGLAGVPDSDPAE